MTGSRRLFAILLRARLVWEIFGRGIHVVTWAAQCFEETTGIITCIKVLDQIIHSGISYLQAIRKGSNKHSIFLLAHLKPPEWD